MEYTKLTLEMTSPEYGAYHRALPVDDPRPAGPRAAAPVQGHQRRPGRRDLRPALPAARDRRGPADDAADQHRGPRRAHRRRRGLDLLHVETGEEFGLTTDGLVLATGYAPTAPAFLDGDPRPDPVRRARPLRRGGDYSVDRDGGEIFVQNAEEHTHSLLAPDLGMGAYRNSVIIAAMLGREVYPVEKRIAVQTFGVPDHLRLTAVVR